MFEYNLNNIILYVFISDLLELTETDYESKGS